jgi:hypothetical protein
MVHRAFIAARRISDSDAMVSLSYPTYTRQLQEMGKAHVAEP